MPRAELETWVLPSARQSEHCNSDSITPLRATSPLALGGGGGGNKESLAQQQDFQSFHTENPLNSVFTEPALELWAFLNSTMVSLNVFNHNQLPVPYYPES